MLLFGKFERRVIMLQQNSATVELAAFARRHDPQPNLAEGSPCKEIARMKPAMVLLFAQAGVLNGTEYVPLTPLAQFRVHLATCEFCRRYANYPGDPEE